MSNSLLVRLKGFTKGHTAVPLYTSLQNEEQPQLRGSRLIYTLSVYRISLLLAITQACPSAGPVQ